MRRKEKEMTAVKNASITRYQHGEYYIDIVCQGKSREAWLVRKDYGISMLMFGDWVQQGRTFDQFVRLVSKNLPEYIADYEKQYC